MTYTYLNKNILALRTELHFRKIFGKSFLKWGEGEGDYVQNL